MIETIKQIICILSVISRQICLLVVITSLPFRIRRNCHKFNVHINCTNLLQLSSKLLSQPAFTNYLLADILVSRVSVVTRVDCIMGLKILSFEIKVVLTLPIDGWTSCLIKSCGEIRQRCKQFIFIPFLLSFILP